MCIRDRISLEEKIFPILDDEGYATTQEELDAAEAAEELREKEKAENVISSDKPDEITEQLLAKSGDAHSENNPNATEEFEQGTGSPIEEILSAPSNIDKLIVKSRLHPEMVPLVGEMMTYADSFEDERAKTAVKYYLLSTLGEDGKTLELAVGYQARQDAKKEADEKLDMPGRGDEA